jgi:hypothetical protein
MSDAPPALWTAAELAAFLGFRPHTIANMLCRSPERLPPRVTAIASPRWVPAVCQEWATRQSAPAKRNAGRPRVT